MSLFKFKSKDKMKIKFKVPSRYSYADKYKDKYNKVIEKEQLINKGKNIENVWYTMVINELTPMTKWERIIDREPLYEKITYEELEKLIKNMGYRVPKKVLDKIKELYTKGMINIKTNREIIYKEVCVYKPEIKKGIPIKCYYVMEFPVFPQSIYLDIRNIYFELDKDGVIYEYIETDYADHTSIILPAILYYSSLGKKILEYYYEYEWGEDIEVDEGKDEVVIRTRYGGEVNEEEKTITFTYDEFYNFLKEIEEKINKVNKEGA